MLRVRFRDPVIRGKLFPRRRGQCTSRNIKFAGLGFAFGYREAKVPLRR